MRYQGGRENFYYFSPSQLKYCQILKVLVNNVAAEYTLTDSLQNLSQKQSLSIEEIDVNYRAALEITRSGELQIIVPKLTSNASTIPPRAIPRKCSKEVHDRFKSLISLYRNLTEIRDYGNDNDVDADPDGEIFEKPCYMLQITIVYKLEKPQSGSLPAGYSVRLSPPFSVLFAKTIPIPQGESLAKSTFCIHSIISQSDKHCGRDVDGVRCWLPCFDSLDQRLVFDISLKIPRKSSVMCSGERISSIKVPRRSIKADGVAVESGPMKITRFFTPTRIAAGSVGFFVGSVESYNMPLYKVNGKFWVTTGLHDFSLTQIKSASRKKPDSSTGSPRNNASKGEKQSRKRAISAKPNTIQHHSMPVETAPIDAAVVKIPAETTAESEVVNSAEERKSKRQRLDSLDVISDYDLDALLNVTTEYAAVVGASAEAGISSTEVNTVSSSAAATLSLDIKAVEEGQLETKKVGKASKSKSRTTPRSAEESDNENAEEEVEAEELRAQSKLYADLVHHSSLGLDMAMRRLHKFVEKKYCYSHFAFIFVHDLGCDFMAFDGFALVNAKFLCGPEDVYLESSAHLVLVSAYLYSWMKTSLPLSSYEAKFILHGTVGYLLNVYVEEVFGEEEGKYRYQKQYDTVIELEKQGSAMPLFTFYPELYELFTLEYGEYANCKATVLFHLIESSVGGREPMRAAVKQIIRSQPLYSTAQQNQAVKQADSGEQSPSSSSVVSTSRFFTNNLIQDDRSITSGDISPGAQSAIYGMGGTTPYGGHTSPYYNAGNNSVIAPYAGSSFSPYYGGNMSPTLSTHYTAGETSPYYQYNSEAAKIAYFSPSHAFSQSPAFGPGGFVGGGTTPSHLSPPMALYRQPSISSETGWGRDFSALCSDSITAEGLILTCRFASGASSDIDQSFLDKYIYSSGGCAIFARLNATITQKIENKPRQIIINHERIGLLQCRDVFRIPDGDLLLLGQLSGPVTPVDDVKVRLAEVRDDVVTEPILNLVANRPGMHQQQAFSRPGRHKGRGKSKKFEEGYEMSAEMQEEIARREKEKEERKPVLQLVRDMLEHPIRYAMVDPQMLNIIAVQNTSSDSLLIEQLFADLGDKNIFIHCQALRSIARAAVTTAGIVHPGVANSADSAVATKGAPLRSDRSAKLHIKTLSTCLMASPPLSASTVDANCISGGHSYFVRAEAAYALAKWQNLNAPKHLSSTSSVTTAEISVTGTATWHAMNALIDCIQDLFMFEDSASDSHLPLPSDFTNESQTYLRNAVLLALSTIKCQSGHTPIRIVDLLLKFYNYRSESNSSSSGGSATCSDIHYRATLLYAFSRIRFENISSISYSKRAGVSQNSSSLVGEVIEICRSTIEAAFTAARAAARIEYMALATVGEAFSRTHRLPSLQGGGLDAAAAITCLAEIDVQATLISSAPNPNSSHSGEEQDRKSIGSSVSPTGVGLASGFNYVKCILDPSTSFRCVLMNSGHPSHHEGNRGAEPRAGKGVANIKEDSYFFLCNPLIRVAAFEAFVRLCFAQYSSHESRFFALHGGSKKSSTTTAGGEDDQGQQQQAPKLPESTFIAAIFEVLQAVLKTDPM